MIAGLVNRAWLTAAWPAARAYAAALADPRRAQEDLLRRLLRRDAGSDFGRRHGFADIVSPAGFRERVPLRTWAAVAPEVARIAAGESGVLGAEPVLRLVPTSGSSAACKLVPWTRGLHRAFAAAFGPWLHDLVRRHPGIADGPAYWAVSPPAQPELAPSAVPVGFGDDTAYLGGILGPLVARALALPPGDPALADPRRWLDATCRHLLRCRDLRLISVWHPSFLFLILDRLRDGWDVLLSGMDAREARVLARLDPGDLRRIWPDLAAVSCWADGPAAVPAAALARRLGGIPLEPKGLLSTEGVASLPWRGAMPPALRSHVLEVLGDDGVPRWIHELRPGMSGEIVLSNGGGLWRYRTGDRVAVDGMVRAAPSLRFLGRIGTVHDLAGEKLDEAQVAAAFATAGLAAGFAALRPAPARRCWELVLDRDTADAAATAARVETALQGCIQYGVARRLGQLAPLHVVVDPRPTGAILADLAAARGQRAGALKPPLLLPG